MLVTVDHEPPRSGLLAAAYAARDVNRALRDQCYLSDRLEDAAWSYWRRNRRDDAVACLATAAWLATLAHPGRLASPQLESLLGQVSAWLPQARARSARMASRERVLLVVTELRGVGGHTRVAWRWIARDPHRVYTIATTTQRGPLPPGIAAAAAGNGGRIVNLPRQRTALERARSLRDLAADADLVVLIDHPYDIVPMLAFSAMERRPPIVRFNHADHTFWVGRSIADALMCIRRIGETLAVRRGYPQDRILLTPFPTHGPDSYGGDHAEEDDQTRRQHARKRLLGQMGWPADSVILATVGAAHKYAPVSGVGLTDLVEPVLAEAPDARLVAVGPSLDDRWRSLTDRTGGRVACLGPLSQGVGAIYGAADIYLDPFPLSGTGSAGEAASHALPVIGMAANDDEARIYGTDPEYGAVYPIGAEAYRELLASLIVDEDLRRAYGEAARARIAAADAGWGAAMEKAYSTARALGPVALSELQPVPATDDMDVYIDLQLRLNRTPAADWLDHLVALLAWPDHRASARRLLAPSQRLAFRQLGRFAARLADERRARQTDRHA